MSQEVGGGEERKELAIHSLPSAGLETTGRKSERKIHKVLIEGLGDFFSLGTCA